MTDLAIDHWVEILAPFSQRSIEQAFANHLRVNGRVRPTPGDIREKARSFQNTGPQQAGDRSELTSDERYILEEKIIPTARRWVAEFPPSHILFGHGRQTLAYWGEAAE